MPQSSYSKPPPRAQDVLRGLEAGPGKSATYLRQIRLVGLRRVLAEVAKVAAVAYDKGWPWGGHCGVEADDGVANRVCVREKVVTMGSRISSTRGPAWRGLRGPKRP